MKTIMVTGGSGFIGQHLIRKLLETNKIISIDKQNTYSDDIKANPNFEYIVDKTKFYSLDLDFSNIEYIYHLASDVGVNNVQNNPLHTLIDSTNLTNTVIKIATDYNIKMFFSSSSEVYGLCKTPASETWNTVTLPSNYKRGAYVAQKIYHEHLLTCSTNNYTIGRFFNIVGDGQKYGSMIMPTFIENAKNNKDLVIYGDGENIRTYCHIDDCINSMIHLMKNETGIFNIGNPKNSYSVNTIAKKIIEYFDSSSNIVHEEPRQFEIPLRQVNINKLIQSGYTPDKNFNDILDTF